MYPEVEPLTISLRTGEPSSDDALHDAWTHLTRARAVPYERSRATAWLDAFRAELTMAVQALNIHVSDAEHETSCLALGLEGCGDLAKTIRRQFADHVLLDMTLEALIEMTCAPDNDALGEYVRSHDALATAELQFALHHRRLEGILREIGLITRFGCTPPEHPKM